MTIKEAIERLRRRICCEGSNRADHTFHFCTDECMYGESECEIALAIKALEIVDKMNRIWYEALNAYTELEKMPVNEDGNVAELLQFAHWERPYPTTPKSYTRICSRCKGTAYVIGGAEYPRCPHCGAIMSKKNADS